MSKQKLTASILIAAPKEKVWEVMLSPESYKEWTKHFNPTSRFVGDWSEGSKMLFVGIDEETGNEMGMVSRIAKNIPNQYVSIEHLGLYANGVEDTSSEMAQAWSPAFENYTLAEKDGGTEFVLDQDIEEEYLEMFQAMWAEALNELKALCEK